MKRILVIAAVAAACGGSSGTAVDHNRAGSGSSTLLVTGTVTVTVHNSASGDVALTEAQTGSRVYTGSKTS